MSMNINDYLTFWHRNAWLPDDVSAGMKVVKCRKKMLIAWPACGRKQHPNMQLRYCHT